jgi:hypothetical protein
MTAGSQGAAREAWRARVEELSARYRSDWVGVPWPVPPELANRQAEAFGALMEGYQRAWAQFAEASPAEASRLACRSLSATSPLHSLGELGRGPFRARAGRLRSAIAVLSRLSRSGSGGSS